MIHILGHVAARVRIPAHRIRRAERGAELVVPRIRRAVPLRTRTDRREAVASAPWHTVIGLTDVWSGNDEGIIDGPKCRSTSRPTQYSTAIRWRVAARNAGEI